MSGSTSIYTLRHELRGEFFVLRVLIFCIVTYLFLQVASMFRLFGVPGIPPLLLLSYRTLDLIVIGSFLLKCGLKLKVRWVDFPLFLMILYPILFGIGNGNINITFFNDIATFLFFLLKVLIIRTLLLRFMYKTNFDEVFRSYAQKIIKRSIFAAILMLMLAYLALIMGVSFYYQAPAELTFAAALAMAQGYAPTYLMIFALALIGGKRGIIIGILALGVVGILTRKNFAKVLTQFLPLSVIVAIAIVSVMFLVGDSSLSDAVFMRRLTGTWFKIESVVKDARSWGEFLLFLDPGRYVEYISLKPHLQGWALWFGNGFGFRYNLDSIFLHDVGRVSIESSVTNAHFTPLAIVAKFGLLGLFLWFVQILGVLFWRWNSSSFVQAASRLGFVSMLIQSIFAFSFFISFFTPIFFAGATVRRERRNIFINGARKAHPLEVI